MCPAAWRSFVDFNMCARLPCIPWVLNVSVPGQGEVAVDVPSCVAALESAAAEALQEGRRDANRSMAWPVHITGTAKDEVVLAQGPSHSAPLQHARARPHHTASGT